MTEAKVAEVRKALEDGCNEIDMVVNISDVKNGLWKVYGDEKKAKELFAKYKKCTDIYCERYEAGCGIAELAVAV